MTVNEVWLDGTANPLLMSNQPIFTTDKNGNQALVVSLMTGSAVETLPGVFLTASHVIAGPLYVDQADGSTDVYPVIPIDGSFQIGGLLNYNSQDKTDRSVTQGNAVTSINLLGYDVKYSMQHPGGPDLGIVQSKPLGSGTGMMVFLKPSASQINSKFSSLSYTGYKTPTDENLVGAKPIANTSTGNTVVSVDQSIYGTTLFGEQGVIAGGNGTLQINGQAPPGTSGAGVWGISSDDKKEYVIGTIQGQYPGANSPTTTVNYITDSYLNLITNKYTPSDDTLRKALPRNRVIGSADGGDTFAGVSAPVDYTGSIGNNKILAGKYGDTINVGQGLGNEIFLSKDDLGTTIVVSPGSCTIVGGSANDRLVVPEDRLWTRATGNPTKTTIKASSDVVPILGGLYVSRATNDTYEGAIANDQSMSTSSVPILASFDTTSSIAGQQGSTDPLSWEIGDYDLMDNFQYDGKDLQIEVIAGSPDIPHPTPSSVMWRTTITIKDYKAGDFGLTFKPYSASPPDWSDYEGTMLRNYTNKYQDNLSMMGTPTAYAGVNDDPSQTWDYTSMQPITAPSDSDLASDQATLEHLYDSTSFADVTQTASIDNNNSFYSSDFGQTVKLFNSNLGTAYSLASGIKNADPTALELESLRTLVDSGKSSIEIADGLLSSSDMSSMSDVDFVNTLYDRMLGRGSDSGGLNYYTGVLQNGTSRSELVLEFAISSERSSVLSDKFRQGVYFPDEHASEIARLYYAAYDRAPDLPGLRIYTTQLDASGDLAPIADNFLKSSEGSEIYNGLTDRDFVNTAFLNAFGRPADSGASDYYSSQLAQGETRGSVLSILVNSSEGVNYRAPQIEQGLVHV